MSATESAPMKDFFISYNAADKQWAEWIAWQLEAGGYSVVIQAWDFAHGGNFVLDMQRAIEGSRRTLLVLSPDFLKSKFTAPEWAAAFARDPTGSASLLLPVRVRACQPSGLLAQLVYVDLVGLEKPEARDHLLAAAATSRRRPEVEPGMPPVETNAAAHPVQHPLAPEPPWPPSLRLAGGLLRQLLIHAAVAFVVAFTVYRYLRHAMPNWPESALPFFALVWGAFGAAVFAVGSRLWRRRGVQRSRG